MLGGLTPKLLAAGTAVLRANTRGHDIVSTGPSSAGHALLGAAFERVSEATIDLAAWLKLLSDRGYQRVGLLGHSLGAIKAIYALAADNPPQVAALVAASPPRLSFEHFRGSRRGSEFLQNFADAERLVASGRGDELMLVQFPIAYYVTAAGFIDRYGPAERYNILRLLGKLRSPTLITYGSTEVLAHDAFRGMPEAVEAFVTEQNRLQTAVIAGADHQYTGCYDVLAARIHKWAARLPRDG
jgi:pimeloyl-ACP methyl ester carboxylesterase